MVCSGDFNPGELITLIHNTVVQFGFIINSKKTRVARQGEQQRVTGIIVNKKMQVDKFTRKKFRQQVYYIRRYGLYEHIERKKINKDNYLIHLIGIGNFISFINKEDKKVIAELKYLKTLQNELQMTL